LYVYDVRVVQARMTALMSALPASADVFYAVKANGSLGLVDQLRRLGCGADVCSLGELQTVRAAGFSTDRVLYTGPAKSEREITEAVSWGIGLIVVESAAEAAQVAAVAGRAGVRQSVLLRVNPGPGLARSGIAMTAPSCKFGVDEADASMVAGQVRALPNVELRGIHVSTDSNVCSAAHLLERGEYTFALAARLRDEGCPIEVVDLGGGIGAPHSASGAAIDIEAYCGGLQRIVDRHPGVSVIIEPGRYPVAESGTYLVSVVAVKRSAGATFALVDGGINHLNRPRLTPAGSPPPVLSASDAALELVTVAGPLLDADDVLAEAVRIPYPAAGDLLAVPGCGAYGFSHGLHGFCLHATPAEVVWDGVRLHLVRERGEPLTVTAGQHLPRSHGFPDSAAAAGP
jgi:diaminopimelate decarboxylase